MRKRDDEKEKSIKEAVIKLILEEGFHGTSISKIAKEAGVSPATVYVYFENKEVMLQDIYREYSEEIYHYLLDKLSMDMDGRQIIELLVRGYYTYIKEHGEIFNFVEQFSNCPSLSASCSSRVGICHINDLLNEMKNRQVLRSYRNDNLLAIIFYPVKSIALNRQVDQTEREEHLAELIGIIQSAVLR